MKRRPKPPPGLTVVKVGGSLFGHPRLGTGLRAWLDGVDVRKTLVVAGGGEFADAVRTLDRQHRLGEEKAHDLALHAAKTSAWFLASLLDLQPSSLIIEPQWWARNQEKALFLDCWSFLVLYQMMYGPVPHTWELTTDSIAAYAAATGGARLVLLKSVDIPPGTPWEEAAARGWVDAHFPTVVREHQLNVEVVNFRGWLDAR